MLVLRRCLLLIALMVAVLLIARLPVAADESALLEKGPDSAGPAIVATAVASEQSPAEPPATPAAPAERRQIRTDIPLAVQARQAAERALPYIEKDGTTWIKDRKCLTCHYVSFMVWSFRDAGRNGFDVDKTKLAEWTDWSLNHAIGQGIEGPAQMLLARDRADTSEATAKLIETLRDAIINGQDPAGFWKPGGQLPGQKRPLTETTQVSTMWNVLALETLDPPHDKGIESRGKALEWLKKSPPNGGDAAVSSEWYAARLLIEKKFGQPEEFAAIRDQILAAQQSDGGWGWRYADKSDAFGTGVSLYAFGQVGLPNSHPAVRRAWTFLIETQTADGSWSVHGTKTSAKDKPHPFSSFWGSTWAVLGLSSTLPAPASTAAAASTSPVISAE